LMFTTP